jgi:acetyltransferase-like isoleucine patch superfamily enzyme
MIHPLSEVQSKKIGEETSIWQFVIVLPDAEIGANCNINSHVLIENDVIIGDNVTIKSGVQVWDGLRIENNVFIGPNVTFTNDLIPRSKVYPKSFLNTTIKKRASIGANSTIIGGITIGEFAMVGAGSVVTKSVKKNELWYGNPAEQKGYITDTGEILNMNLISKETGNKYIWNENKLIKND